MFDSLREAAEIVDENPVMIVFGTAIAGLQAGRFVFYGAASADVGTFGFQTPLLAVVSNVAVIMAVPVPLLGLYAICREEITEGWSVGDGSGTLLHRTSTVVRKHYGRLLLATVLLLIVGMLFAVILTVLCLLVLLIADTAVRAGAYTIGNGLDPAPMLILYIHPIVVVGSLLVQRLPFTFYDTLAVFGDERPTRSWATSLRFAIAYPRRIVRYGSVMLGLLGPPLALTYGITQIGTGFVWAVAGSVVYLLFGGVLLTVAGAYHVVFFDREVAPATCDSPTEETAEQYRVTGTDRPLVAHRFRILLVVLVVVGLVVGSVAVRTADVRPGERQLQTESVDGSMEPNSILTNGLHYTVTRSNQQQHRIYEVNETTGERQLATTWWQRLDVADRQVIHGFEDHERGIRNTNYGSSGTLAIYPGDSGSGVMGMMTREVNGWSVIGGPGYYILDPTAGNGFLPRTDTDWQIVSETEETVVIGVENVTELGGTSRYIPQEDVSSLRDDAETRNEFAEDSFVHVSVEKETGYVTRVVRRTNYTVYDRDRNVTRRVNQYTETTVTDYETTDVTRPDEIGDKSAIEYLWDIASY